MFLIKKPNEVISLNGCIVAEWLLGSASPEAEARVCVYYGRDPFPLYYGSVHDCAKALYALISLIKSGRHIIDMATWKDRCRYIDQDSIAAKEIEAIKRNITEGY